MAGLGFKDFAVGEVLTAADVDGYLMQQSVMRFADAGARGSALGTAVGTGVPLAEGMVSYLDDTNSVEVYTGAAWLAVGGFNAGTAITATDTSWSVPALADPVVRLTVVGAGGGGAAGAGYDAAGGAGSQGGSSSFACSAGTATATGGLGAPSTNFTVAGRDGTDRLAASNEGMGGHPASTPSAGKLSGQDGLGGQVVVAYLDLSGVSTANVTIGAGGAGGAAVYNSGEGGDGGDGVVIVEYRAV